MSGCGCGTAHGEQTGAPSDTSGARPTVDAGEPSPRVYAQHKAKRDHDRLVMWLLVVLVVFIVARELD